MKKKKENYIIVAIAMMMSVFVLGAQAQGVSQASVQGKVIEFSVVDFQTCKVFLAQHPTDTIYDGGVKIFLQNGRVVRTAAEKKKSVKMPMTPKKTAVKQVNSGEVAVVRYEDGTSKSFTRKKLSQVTAAERRNVLSGQKEVHLTKEEDLGGRSHRGFYILGQAGADWLPKEDAVHPVFNGNLGYEIGRWGIELSFGRSWGKYPEERATAKGNYDTFQAGFTGLYKVYQSSLSTGNSLSIGGTFGWGYCRSDELEAEADTHTMGATANAFLRWELPAFGHKSLRPVVEGGALLVPLLEGDGYQKWGNVGPYVKIGLKYEFNRR